MTLQQRIEEARQQFVDGKLPETHVLHYEYMATLDWAGPWTDEMKAHAARCVRMWMDNYKKQERQELKSFIELFPVSAKDFKSKTRIQRPFKQLTKEKKEEIVRSLYQHAWNYCNKRSRLLAFSKALKRHGYIYNDAMKFVVTHKIMSENEYRALSKHRIMPSRWATQPTLNA
jgi:hypothetical protein